MRLIRFAIISVIVLFFIITGISLFIPSHVRISKAINIRVTTDSVWNRVDHLENWGQWNPFFTDIDLKHVVKLDTAGGHWNAVKVENTTVRWIEKKRDEHIAELTNSTRRPMRSGWKCIPHNPSDSLTVQWYIDFRLRWYPWEKFASLGLEKTYGTQMELGLTRLKALLEK
jgi:hypothetical protein